MYDYIGYSWLILTFFVALLLAILLAKRSALLSILVLLFSLVLVGVGTFFLKHILDDYLRHSHITVTSVKKLHFSDILIVDGLIQNNSKNPFTMCTLHTNIYKQSSNSLKQFLYSLKPLRKKSILITKGIQPNGEEDFKVVFYNYSLNDDINASVQPECY